MRSLQICNAYKPKTLEQKTTLQCVAVTVKHRHLKIMLQFIRKRLRRVIAVTERSEYYYTEIRVVDISSMCYNNMTIMRRMLLYGL